MNRHAHFSATVAALRVLHPSNAVLCDACRVTWEA
jgi:hypothetical protein